MLNPLSIVNVSSMFAKSIHVKQSNACIQSKNISSHEPFDQECNFVDDMDRYSRRIYCNHHRIIFHHQIQVWKIFVRYKTLIVDAFVSHENLKQMFYVFSDGNFYAPIDANRPAY